MNSIKTYLNSLGRATRVLILAIAVVITGAGITQAATTISTDISTGGTLSVTGASTLTGNVTANGTLGAIGIATFGATASTTISAAGALTTPAGTVATFLGGASTTQFTLLSGDTIKNATASSTALSGSLTVGGGTGSATLTVTNTANATSTATVGCIVTTATSSATSIRLLFNTQATTTSINGNTVQGVVLWGYGSSCAN